MQMMKNAHTHTRHTHPHTDPSPWPRPLAPRGPQEHLGLAPPRLLVLNDTSNLKR